MDRKIAERILARRLRAKRNFSLPPEAPKAPAVLRPVELDLRFTKQNAFILDQSTFIDAQCSRRSGKSTGLAIRYDKTMAKYSGATCIYLALTGDSARDIMWPVLEELDDKYKLGYKFKPSRLTVEHPGGGKLKLFGADMKNFVRRLRGKKSPGIGIDEAQEFAPKHLAYLIDDVMTPMMIDYPDPWLALCGTPGPVPAGYFFQTTKERKHGYSHHEWTLFDNVYLPDPAGFISRLKERRKWPDNHPTLLREYYNQWIVDLETLWIKYHPSVNHFTELPPQVKRWHYILGIDIGYRDADAFAVLAWSDEVPETYLVEEKVVSKQDITSLRVNIQTLQKSYDFHKMVIDTGGLGKKIAEELKNRYGIPLEAADRTRKMESAEILNDALRMGVLKAKSDTKFAGDSYLVQIDWDKSTPDKIVLKKEPHSDIIDAVIYAFKESPSYAYEPPAEGPKPGTPEWDKHLEDQHLKAAVEQVQREKELRDGKGQFGTWNKDKKGIPDWNKW
jgi:hypothetical protein